MPLFLRYAIFISVISATIFGVSLFVYRRLSADFSLEKRGKNVLKALFFSGWVAMIGSRFIERLVPSRAVHLLGIVGAVIVLGVVVTFAVLLVDSTARLLFRSAKKVRGLVVASRTELDAEIAPPVEPSAEPADDVDVGRRDVLAKAVAATAVTLGGGSSVYAATVGRTDYTIEEAVVPLARMSRELDGYTIVQLSDLHVGLDVGERELAAALDLVAQAKPDRIVLTGDLIDHDIRFAPELGRFVRKLGERAPVSAIIGNHDYYAGVRETIDTLRKAGADVLVNGSMMIEDKLVLGGVDDVWATRSRQRYQALSGGPNVIKAFEGTDPDLPRVLLCHNPSYYPQAADHVDLQLSGHTHGGQFSPLVNPARLVLRHGYIRGHYERSREGGDRHEAKSQLYVNRGFGTAGPPARIGSPPEVTKIVLATRV